MAPRLDLQMLLEQTLGSTNVYFQPPPTIQMRYPCIVYKRNGLKTHHADNLPYSLRKSYEITVIDRDPDSEIPARVAELESCRFDRFFTANGLNHDTFTLFF